MLLRRYRQADCRALADLFFQTVHAVNARDYSRDQLWAWADGQVDLSAWDRSFCAHDTWVAVEGKEILGFADMDESGYLDRLYVHREHQGQGIATALCDKLESRCPGDHFTTHASLTARSFFEGRGYRAVQERQVERKGLLLRNVIMEKDRDSQ